MVKNVNVEGQMEKNQKGRAESKLRAIIYTHRTEIFYQCMKLH